MKKRTALSIFIFLRFFINAQSLEYSGPNYFDISELELVGLTNGITSYERTPNGMAFGDSGSKFYTVGQSGDFISQFNLSTPYDLSTMSHLDKYYYLSSAVERLAQDITFNSSGSKMYITGDFGDHIIEFDLPVNWDVSSAVVNDSFDISLAIFSYDGSSATRPNGITFNNDGSKLYIIERDTDKVYEFNLSPAYDVSSATTGVVAELDVSSQESNPRGIAFNNDGSELYVIGMNGDDINIYTFSSGNEYNLASATYSSKYSIKDNETEPQEVIFNDVGSKFYVIGTDGLDVDEYTLFSNFDFTSTVTYINSYKLETIEITIHDVLFNTDGSKMYVAGDALNSVSQFNLPTPYDISTIEFEDALFIGSQETFIRGIQFNNVGDRFYIVGSQSDNIEEYSVSTPFDLSSSVSHLGSYNINSEDSNPSSFTFNNDGSLLFLLGNNTNRIIVYSLSTNYDLSSITSGPIGSFSVDIDDNAPTGLAFKNDGTKFFVTGDENDKVYEYTLITPFDLLTRTPILTNEYLISSHESRITGITFDDIGSKLYIVGLENDNVKEFNLKKGFLHEVSTTNNGSISTSNQLVVTVTGDTFADNNRDNLLDEVTQFSITNLPEGLIPVFTLSNGNTIATLSFDGVAKSHLEIDDVADLVFNFTDAAFSSSTAVTVNNAVGFSDFVGVNFINCYDDIIYNGNWSGGSGTNGEPTIADAAKGVLVQTDVTLIENVDCFCLNVEAGNTLSVATGLELNVSGSLELIGDLRLLGSSQLKQTHSGVKNVSGDGYLFKDVKSNLSSIYDSGYLSSPVTTNGETYNINGVLKDGSIPLSEISSLLNISFVNGYDGSYTTTPISISKYWLSTYINTFSWNQGIDPSTELINPGVGFNFKSTGNSNGQNYTFVGKPNDGDYIHSIDAYGSGTYSLLGNPYPSPIDADLFITDNALSAQSIEGTLYFYQSASTSHKSSDYAGGYATRVIGLGTAAAEFNGSGKVPGQNIDIAQGFFVKASATGGAITFNNAQRVFDVLETDTNFFSKENKTKEKNSFPILRLGFETFIDENKYHRNVAVGFRGLTNNYENGYEAEMWDYNPTDLALKIDNNNNNPFVITGIEDFNPSIIIPLKVRANTNREVTFKVDSFDLDENVYLYDAVLDLYFNLSTEPKTLNLIQGDYNDRFFITFKNDRLSNIDDFISDEILIFNDKKEITIQSSSLLISKVIIFNLLGKEIKSKINTDKSLKLKLIRDNLIAGIYIVKIETDKGTVSKKIIIN
ncbi:T9SS type A sorting domain-containing protein [Polaribacter sargassicola]|uniref:T9SS type A sorting domain-containing protein n=1 Tax=Polaribacter sargassicola TaxID=2836891 RepID=UPI001F334735|nr:T9SS type A sorting domain-containing protein [Polaribacter sp. DS7-9]MCG1036954.1 T9SS type A sorting domain-containing protein [Polaribacter sp. DS7-9]